MSTETTSGQSKGVSIREFTVEFGDEKNRSITISTLRQVVRGHFSLRKFFEPNVGGRDVGSAMQRVPDIPGLFLRITPRERKATLYDPWENKPEEWARLNNSLTNAQAAQAGKYTWVPRQEMALSHDQLKTLIEEVKSKVDGGKARVVKGDLPTVKQIGDMPGRVLYDTMNSGRKPRYADEVEEWERRIDSAAM